MTTKAGPSPEMIEALDKCAPEVAAYMQDLMNQCGGELGDRITLLELTVTHLFWHWGINPEAEFRLLRTMSVHVMKRLAVKRLHDAKPEGSA